MMNTCGVILKNVRCEAGLRHLIEQVVQGFDLDLVEVERTTNGLLRVTIDHVWTPELANQPEQFITIEDCEKVTRQLQYVLQVEDVSYERLEVGSPGIDRLLRHEQDFTRFTGEVVDIVLKEPIGGNAGNVAANRKKFRGTLERSEEAGWRVVWSDAPPIKPGVRVSAKKKAAQKWQSLDFEFADVREARLAPLVNFKGRANKHANQPNPPVLKDGEKSNES